MRRSESLLGSSVLLGAAGGIEFVLQMAIPILLARKLDEVAFAQYRLLWLFAGTALAIVPMFMPQSLFYFLNRAQDREKRAYVINVLVFLAGGGLLCGLFFSSINPFPHAAALLLFQDTAGLSAAFLAFWVMASVLDVLPSADGRPLWQAGAIVGLAILRTAALVAATLFSGTISGIAAVLLIVAVVKLILAGLYLHKHIADRGFRWNPGMLRRQFSYALPFAIGNALFQLRAQADQWIVVSMLPAAMYASFSVAAVVLPVAALIRQPVNNVLLPRLNQAHAASQKAEAATLIAFGNGATALLLVPLAGALFACANEVVELMYTSRYAAAAPVMQIYLIGMMTSAIAAGHVLSALGYGRFAMINSACCLALSVALGIAGLSLFGLRGAAAASMVTLALGELWALLVVARALGTGIGTLCNARVLLPLLFAGASAATVALALAPAGLPAWQRLFVKGALYALTYIPIFLLTGGWRTACELAGFRNPRTHLKGVAHESA